MGLGVPYLFTLFLQARQMRAQLLWRGVLCEFLVIERRGLRELNLGSTTPLPQDSTQLGDLDRAGAVRVPRVEECIDIRCGSAQAELRHGLSELGLIDGAIAVGVPLTKEVDNSHHIFAQGLSQLRHGDDRVMSWSTVPGDVLGGEG